MIPRHTAMLAGAAAFVALASVSGCVRLLPEPQPAPRIYPLRADVPPVIANAPPPAPLVLGVARPNMAQASAGLDLVWLRNGELAYLERSIWEARTPDTIQGLFVETIDLQDLVTAAVQVGEGPRSDYDLRMDLHAFQIEEGFSRGPEARFDAGLKLVRAANREVIAARRLLVTEPLADRRESAAVAALQQVAAEAAAEAGRWAAAEAIAHAERVAAQPPLQPSAASISR